MTGFGDDLKRERESRGITLETLEAETRVKLRHLRSVEEEQFEALPGGLFRRGIVKAYLAAVGLEEVVWLLRFDSALDAYERSRGVSAESRQDSWAAFAQNVKRNRTEAPRSGRAKTIGLLVLLLVVVAAAWAVWVLVLRARLER